MRSDDEILEAWPYKDGTVVPIGSKPVAEKDMEVRASCIMIEVLLDIRRAVQPPADPYRPIPYGAVDPTPCLTWLKSKLEEEASK